MPKISDLAAAASITGADTLVLVQGGVTKKATAAVVAAGTVPTGTGFRRVVAGVEDAAAKLVENADVHASAAIAVSKLAAGTNTHVLTTTGGVPVWAAPAGGGSSAGNANEVQVSDGASGFSAATNVKAGSSYISIGATPLASAGSIRLPEAFSVFARDVGDTDNMHILFMPTGSEVLHIGTSNTFAAGDQVSQVKIYGSGSVEVGGGGTTCAIFGSSVAAFSLPITLGTTSAAAGLVRVPYAAGARTVLAQRDNADTGDWGIIATSGSALAFGDLNTTSTFKGYSVSVVSSAGGGAVELAVSGSYGLTVTATQVKNAGPIVGETAASSPYACHGKTTSINTGDANHTLTAAQYSNFVIDVGAGSILTAARNLTFPAAASATASYTKVVRNLNGGAFGYVCTTGGAQTVTVAQNMSAMILVTDTGVERLTADVATP